MNKDIIKQDSNINSFLKLKRLNTESPKVNEMLYIYNSKNEGNFLKLTSIASNVENRDIYHYKKLVCPICKKRNAVNSLLFENLKEFILYLAYVFTFIPEPFQNCKLFFDNKDEIINFFRNNEYDKSFFKEKNPTLMCKDCLIKKMNQKNFTNIFISIFGCKKSSNSNNKINQKINYSNKSINIDENNDDKEINQSNDNSSLKIIIENNIDDTNKTTEKKNKKKKEENINHENENLDTTCTLDSQFNNQLNNNLLNTQFLNRSSYLIPSLNFNKLNLNILRNPILNLVENNNNSIFENNSYDLENINKKKNNNNYKSELDDETFLKKIKNSINDKTIENFENTFNLIFKGFSNIIFEMRTFNIKTSEKKKDKEYEEYIKKLDTLKTELNHQIKMLSIFQSIYSTDVTKLINTTKNQNSSFNYILPINEMNYIKDESKAISQKFISILYSFESMLKDYLSQLSFEKIK